MGIHYHIRCGNCSYSRSLREGIGEDFHIFETILKKYNVKDKKKIMRILKKYGLKTKTRARHPKYERNPFAEERIYRCRECGNIESQLYIRIRVPERWIFDRLAHSISEEEKRVLYRSVNRCSRCNTRLRHYRGEQAFWNCPDCGEDKLVMVKKESWN